MLIKLYSRQGVGGAVLAMLLALLAVFLIPAASAASAGCERLAPGSISVHCGGAPSATFDESGRLWVAFVQNQQVFVSYSDDLGDSYSAPVVVNPVPEDAEYNGENRPKILVDKDSTIYISWTLKTSPRFTGEIRFSKSTDGGNTFSAPRTINDDELFTGHRFESLFQTESGLLYLTWIDKRDLEASLEAGDTYTGAAVYYAVSRDQGETFSANYRVANHSCECCRIAVAPSGPDNITIFWRHIFGADTRDHAIATLSPDGAVLDMNRASYDEWHIDACPHHGPTMVKSTLTDDYHLSWFTNGDAHQGIYYGRYSPGEKQTVDVRRVDGNPGAGHPYLQTLGDTLYLVWKGFDGQQSLINVMTSKDDGRSWTEPETLMTTSQGSDYPLIIKNEEGLFLSWHTDEHGYLFEQFASSHSWADNFKEFTSESFDEIKADYQGQEFLLGLWSTDCPPCLAELMFMGEVLKLNPDLPYVLISTDPIEEREFALDFLEDYDLAGIESWMFADSFVERLRFSIDPGWYGELPRSYFFDAQHNMDSHSGIVSRELLESWFSRPVTFE